ncbi:MAG: DUF6268 family outer membrane beta-barrel protein [Myxococcota bacterium]
MTVRSATLVLLLALPSAAWAQGGDAIGVQFENAPSTRLEGDSAPENQPEYRFRNVRANAIAPIALERWNAVLLPGFGYRLYAPTETIVGPDGIDTEPFHDLSLRFGVVKRLGDHWSLLVNVGAGLATNFSDVNRDHFRFQGVSLASYTFGNSLTLGFGVLSTYSFGELLVLPALQLRYVKDRWRVNALAPQFLRATYELFDGVEFGVVAQVDGNRFSIGDSENIDSVSFSQADAGLTVGANVIGPVWVTVSAGTTLQRRFVVFGPNDEELADLTAERGPVYRLGVVLRGEGGSDGTP